MSKLRSVKGMNDVLPEDAARWHRLESTFRELVGRYGFGEVRTPLVEPTDLFVRSIGEATDIVEKEMYTFEDKGEKSLTLRPEGTASAARAWIQHSVGGKHPVSKWFYLGPMYRRERPAKGRYRQFWQAGCEIYGDPGPYVDAELIDFVVRYLRALGIQDIEVLVNSLGAGGTRDRYRDALLEYLRPHASELSEDSQRRLERNPLRVLDSKAPQDQAIAENAPDILDHLDEESREHFETLKSALDDLGTPYRVEPRLVRGLDYYTRTLFEVRGRGGDLGANAALCGGGRYDNMIAELGGPATPAIGFAIGLDRLLLVMAETEPKPTLDGFLVVQAKELRGKALAIAQTLRDAGARVDADLRGGSMKSQFRRADKSSAPFALILGEREAAEGTVQVKELATGEQRELPIDQVAAAIIRD
ncbi:MAG: histidine--tRNA ligase [Sandaracinus sp.]|nr:histidine--tRNA ligase [Sandaracinus sp.]|tara:strand:- start:65 stop:1318 length:1254 start_codon:yes stop_codon:yes gene_type:complete